MAAEDDASTKAAAAVVAQEEASVVGSKRKAAEGKVKEDERVTAAAANGETLVLASGEIYVDPTTGIKWVDMPESYLGFVLSQKMLPPSNYNLRQCTWLSPEEIETEVEAFERLNAMKAGVREEFFEFQAWVRETYETRGRVLVPVDFIPDPFMSEE